MKESDFIFYLVQLMYYRCHKVHFKSGGSYIDSPDWIKGKTQQYIQKMKMINFFTTKQLLH